MSKDERYVQAGRVAFVAFGPFKGKLVTIAEIIDQNQVLVDGPCSGVPRQAMSLKQLHLTRIAMKIDHGSRTKTVRKAWAANDVDKRWAQTQWCKKLERKKLRAQMTDFDRFKLMRAKQARNRILNVEFGKLRKTVKPKMRKPNKTFHSKV